MEHKKQDYHIVNQAWEHLHQRLEKDGLLPGDEAGRQKNRLATTTQVLAVAAVFVACILIGWVFTRQNTLPEKEMLLLYNEANAPTLATLLEDGSVVYLSGQASLHYPDHFADDKREVTLLGDAFFDIKRQADRPFFVETELATVEVLGTSFSIKSDRNNSFLLSVREGEVRVSRKSRQQVITVKTGETVLFDSEQLQLIKNTTDFDPYFKRIQFKDERLANVATILNMHSTGVQLKIEPEIEERMITFPFSIESDITEIAKAICLVLDLHYTQQENILYISQQP